MADWWPYFSLCFLTLSNAKSNLSLHRLLFLKQMDNGKQAINWEIHWRIRRDEVGCLSLHRRRMVVLVAAQLKSGECCGKKKIGGEGGGGKIGPFKSSFFMPLVKITKKSYYIDVLAPCTRSTSSLF